MSVLQCILMSTPEQPSPNEADWREAAMSARLHAGAVYSAFQERVREMSLTLRNARWQQQRSLEDVARSIGIAPEILGYWEMGWIEPEECVRLLDAWVNVLGQQDNPSVHALQNWLSTFTR